jgi:hypothetical protein
MTGLPAILPPTVQLIKDANTSAGRRVYENDPPARITRFPICWLEHEGGVPPMEGTSGPIDNRVDEARIVVNCLAHTNGEAMKLQLEIRDVILPPANIVWGVVRVVGDVQFSGAILETGPRTAAGDRSRVIATYLIQYFSTDVPTTL